jgi:hypothetical protein
MVVQRYDTLAHQRTLALMKRKRDEREEIAQAELDSLLAEVDPLPTPLAPYRALLPGELLTSTHTPFDCAKSSMAPPGRSAAVVAAAAVRQASLPVDVYHSAIGFTADDVQTHMRQHEHQHHTHHHHHNSEEERTNLVMAEIGRRVIVRHELETAAAQRYADEWCCNAELVESELLGRLRDAGKRPRRKEAVYRVQELQIEKNRLSCVLVGAQLLPSTQIDDVFAANIEGVSQGASEEREFIAELDLPLEQLIDAGFVERRLGTSMLARRFGHANAARAGCAYRGCPNAILCRLVCRTHLQQYRRIVQRKLKMQCMSEPSAEKKKRK